MGGLALALLLLALLIWRWSARLQRQSGLPNLKVRGEDMVEREGELLRSARYRLVGKPDYLLTVGGRLVPVEVKPTRRAPQPYPSDLMQLAAYCLLVEESFGRAPRYGILRYADQSWKIPWDDQRRAALLATLGAMDDAEQRGRATRSHEQPARCRGCGQRVHCDQALG
ncbi:MAG: Dna2/Cas4 domain-containing protein [Ardenticatenales bacterium]|nr:Dna2/Cas4 domain-containing protein [Ardenticatenales bacterium]